MSFRKFHSMNNIKRFPTLLNPDQSYDEQHVQITLLQVNDREIDENANEVSNFRLLVEMCKEGEKQVSFIWLTKIDGTTLRVNFSNDASAINTDSFKGSYFTLQTTKEKYRTFNQDLSNYYSYDLVLNSLSSYDFFAIPLMNIFDAVLPTKEADFSNYMSVIAHEPTPSKMVCN